MEKSLARIILDLDAGPLDPDDVKAAFQQVAKRAHPDAGGNDLWFRAALAARDKLLEGVEEERETWRPPPPPKQEPPKPPPPPKEQPLPMGWRRSAKGNAWRRCDECDEPITVFRQNGRWSSGYNWVHNSTFGPGGWAYESDAIDAFDAEGCDSEGGE